MNFVEAGTALLNEIYLFKMDSKHYVPNSNMFGRIGSKK